MSFDQFNNFPLNNPDSARSWVEFDTDEDILKFIGTSIAGGTMTVIDTVAGGAARLSGAATTDDSGVAAQKDTGWIQLPANKTIRLSDRVRYGESTSTDMPTQSDMMCGIGTAGAVTALGAPTDGIYFRNDDGDAILDCVIYAGGVAILNLPTNITLVKDTWYRLEIRIAMGSSSGSGTVTFYVDGVSVASLTTDSLPASTVTMAEFLVFQTGNNLGTKYIDWDWTGVDLAR